MTAPMPTTPAPVADAPVTAPVVPATETAAPTPDRQAVARRLLAGDESAFSDFMAPRAETPARDEAGRFASSATDTPDATQPEAAADGEAVADASDTVPPVTVAEDGTLTAPDLSAIKVPITANGETSHVPLSDLIRRAQSEAGAQRLAQTTQQELAALRQEQEQAVVEFQAFAQRILLDDQFRAEQAAALQQYLSPEAQLERLQAERDALAQQTIVQQRQQEAAAVMSTIAPVVEHVLAQFPPQLQTIAEAAILGRFQSDTAAWQVNGQIPPERYADVQQWVAEALPSYASQLQQTLAAPAQQAAAQVQQAQVAAQQAKNAMAAAVRPAGAAPSFAPQKPTIRSIKDAERYALGAFSPR